MLLSVTLPETNEELGRARIDEIYPAVGAELQPGTRLVDFTVGLDAAFAHECPPVTTYRMTLRERAWLRQIDVATGDMLASRTRIAVLSSAPDEPLDGQPARGVRVSVAAVLREPEW